MQDKIREQSLFSINKHMKTNYEIRYAAHPEDAKHYDTQRLRCDFLIEKVFAEAERQRIVKTELTNAGRVGVILLSPS